jgi:small conductance mechanosensitive channel
MEMNALIASATATLLAVAWRVIGALLLWLAGRWFIGFAVRVLRRTLSGQRFDATLTRYLERGLSVLLNAILIVAILGYFGVETTTFAALLAAGGVAIGVAWGGLLSNFAAGAFLVFLRPFRVGDFVTVGGVTGTVDAIGLFGTTLNTPDNVMTIIGNNKIFSDTIQNFSTNLYRRIDLTATINHSVDHRVATRLLKERLAQIPNVLTTPAPVVEILQLTPAGPLLCVRPFSSNQHYWQVYFDTNRVIRESFGEAGFPVPVPGYAVTGFSASQPAGDGGGRTYPIHPD